MRTIGPLALALLLITSCGTQHREPAAPPAVEPFVVGEIRTLHSDVLGQDRTLNIYLPVSYGDSTYAYPVVYLLDGSADEDFPHIAGLVQFMNLYNLYPQSIVVGIANVDRKHDFTHVTQGDSDLVWLPTAGGSAAFMEFMAKEMQPFITEHYRTTDHRTLIGQSLGGLLATEVLFKKPELFDDYVIVSPSLWWDNGSLSTQAETWAKANATSPKRVFIAMANNDDWSQVQVDSVLAAFKRHTHPPFRWSYELSPHETHATILHRAVYRGFEFLGTEQ
ncbi:MAG: alpha/beta hydrolase [Flavobacteriales bacterium]|nr:alpha/beta hydrolase [Flavobacteriales bacterium]MCC6936943.1 alpha/beta hydrolase [Flavobacteriales bacterium]